MAVVAHSMTGIVNVTKPDDIEAANDVIHDCFFSVEDISFDSEASVLSFKFHRPMPSGRLALRDFVYSSKTKPMREYMLIIRNVKSYSIEDTEKVGTYDFDVLEFDPSTHRISIRTNIPIAITVVVRDLDIWIEEQGGRTTDS
jgi:hypothetical protein